MEKTKAEVLGEIPKAVLAAQFYHQFMRFGPRRPGTRAVNNKNKDEIEGESVDGSLHPIC